MNGSVSINNKNFCKMTDCKDYLITINHLDS